MGRVGCWNRMGYGGVARGGVRSVVGIELDEMRWDRVGGWKWKGNGKGTGRKGGLGGKGI